MKPLFIPRRLKPSGLKALLLNPTALTLGTICVVVALYVVGTPILDAIELNWLDLRFRTRGPIAPNPNVVLAVIDEKSLEVEGRWPWPRSKIAALLDALSRDGAHTIGFDITFAEPDENSRLDLVDKLAHKVDTLRVKVPELAAVLEASRVDADNDRALAKALERSKAEIVLGYFFHMSEAEVGHKLDPGAIERQLRGIANSKYPLVMFTGRQAAEAPFLKAYAPQGNLDVFTQVVQSSGFFSVASDPDGVVRWMPLMIQAGEDLFPPLPLLLYWHYVGKPPMVVRVGAGGVEGVNIGERFIPTDELGQLLINYRGPPKTFPHYAISDILGGKVPAGTFKDKIVLVGATSVGIGDVRSTPFAPVYPGPEIQATVVDNLLVGDFIARPRWSRIFDLVAIVALPLLVLAILPRLSAFAGLFFVVTLFIAFVTVAYELFVGVHIWLNMVYPVFALAGTYTLLTLYRYLVEERERRRIKETFQHYVSHEVIEQVLNDPEHLKLGGQERVLTVLFSDLAGFTSYSERYSPTEIIGVLTEYYDRMTEQVFANRGTLTAYVGDELMAIFGAPVQEKDHAKLACTAALAMRDARHALADTCAKVGRPPLDGAHGHQLGPDAGRQLRLQIPFQLQRARRPGESRVAPRAAWQALRRRDHYRRGHRRAHRKRLPVARARQGAGQGAQAGACASTSSLARRVRCYRRARRRCLCGTRRRWTSIASAAGTRRRRCLRSAWRCGHRTALRAPCGSGARRCAKRPLPDDWDGSYEHLTKG